MGRTVKGKAKTAAKIAKADRKIARKCKGKCASLLAAFGLAILATGCSTSHSAQPAKAQTQNNTFDDCIFVVATHCSVSNRIVTAEGTKDAPSVELLTQTQSLESNGTESFAQTATQTPTTDVKPDVDLHYNDAVGKGSQVATSFLDSLTAESAALLRSYIAGKKTGNVTVTKKDGTTQTVECKDGECAECQDCVVK